MCQGFSGNNSNKNDQNLLKSYKDFGNQDNKKDKKRLTNIERDGNIIRLNFKTGENAK